MILVLSAQDLPIERCAAFQAFYPFEDNFTIQATPFVRDKEKHPLIQVREYIALNKVEAHVREGATIALVLPDNPFIAVCLVNMILSITDDLWIIEFVGNIIHGSILVKSINYIPPKLPDGIQF